MPLKSDAPLGHSRQLHGTVERPCGKGQALRGAVRVSLGFTMEEHTWVTN